MPNNDIVLQQHNAATMIVGVLDVSADMKPYVGIAKAANSRTYLQRPNESDIRHAVMEQIMHGGKLVAGAHVKFAQPIVLLDFTKGAGAIALEAKIKKGQRDKQEAAAGGTKDMPLADPRIASLFEPQSEPDAIKDQANTSTGTDSLPAKRASDNTPATIDWGAAPEVLTALPGVLQSIVKAAQAGTFDKEAAYSYCSTSPSAFWSAIREGFVDGKDVGFNLPVKIDFKDEGAKQAFLSLAKVKKMDEDTMIRHSTTKAASVLSACVTTPISGLVKAMRAKFKG
jgi:hypothetical protein